MNVLFLVLFAAQVDLHVQGDGVPDLLRTALISASDGRAFRGCSESEVNPVDSDFKQFLGEKKFRLVGEHRIALPNGSHRFFILHSDHREVTLSVDVVEMGGQCVEYSITQIVD